MDKNQILTIAIAVVFATVVGFYAGRFYEVKTVRKTFMNIRGSNVQQGQRFIKNNVRGDINPVEQSTPATTR